MGRRPEPAPGQRLAPREMDEKPRMRWGGRPGEKTLRQIGDAPSLHGAIVSVGQGLLPAYSTGHDPPPLSRSSWPTNPPPITDSQLSRPGCPNVPAREDGRPTHVVLVLGGFAVSEDPGRHPVVRTALLPLPARRHVARIQARVPGTRVRELRYDRTREIRAAGCPRAPARQSGSPQKFTLPDPEFALRRPQQFAGAQSPFPQSFWSRITCLRHTGR